MDCFVQRCGPGEVEQVQQDVRGFQPFDIKLGATAMTLICGNVVAKMQESAPISGF